jgi:hypothetical protein
MLNVLFNWRNLSSITFLMFCSFVSLGQFFLTGYVIDATTREPLAFATLKNKNTQSGTLAREDGKFSIALETFQDTIEVSYIGYDSKSYVPKRGQGPIVISLSVSSYMLQEVVIKPTEENYLHTLLEQCRLKILRRNHPIKAKAYLETKSFRNNEMIEFYERYVEGTFNNYDVTHLNLKVGRLAVKPMFNRFFFSKGISSGILKMKLINKNDFFPTNPLELEFKKRKKSFYLQLDRAFQNEDLDSILIISYWPKINRKGAFKGQIWLNKSHHFIERISMDCDSANRSPFIAQFPVHQKIINITFRINKFYTQVNGYPQVSHTYFDYIVDYNADLFSDTSTTFQVITKSVLYAYDFKDMFYLPLYNNTESNDDYRTLSSMPFNDFFWRNHSEFRFTTEDLMLEFSRDSSVLLFCKNSSSIFADNPIFNKPLGYQHPYTLWSNNRISLSSITEDTLNVFHSNKANSPLADYYHLDVNLFTDLNNYLDTLHCLSSVIINPFNSYYRLPKNAFTDVVLNIAFDLCEIERRDFERRVSTLSFSDSSEAYQKITALHQIYQAKIKTVKAQYFRDVQRGNNLKALLKYNELVKKELNIDNIALFGLSDLID